MIELYIIFQLAIIISKEYKSSHLVVLFRDIKCEVRKKGWVFVG